MRDSGGELLQYRLVIEPRAARRARHVVGSLLEGWRLGRLADDVVSCVSELVTNVYEHTAKSATAELSVSWVPGSSLTVEVRDEDSRLPRRRRTAELGVLPFAGHGQAAQRRAEDGQAAQSIGHATGTRPEKRVLEAHKKTADHASDLHGGQESGRRESNPHDQLGRLGLYH